MEHAVQIKNSALLALAFMGSMLTEYLGGWDAAMQALVFVMVADFITGWMVAAIWKKSRKTENGALDSKAGFKGICKKGVILLIVLMAVRLDAVMGQGDLVRNAAIFFFLGNEGLSILENTAVMGVPWPPVLKNALEAMKEKGGEEREE